ncbi:MAG: 2OG-Fe dioxygenase family protein [Sphingomonadales bacterium]|nr:2OG-Fe dioxygenase family protein [Sphingomonadales bacterium]
MSRGPSTPGEALLLDDRTARHEMSAIGPAIENAPAWRDTLS